MRNIFLILISFCISSIVHSKQDIFILADDSYFPYSYAKIDPTIRPTANSLSYAMKEVPAGIYYEILSKIFEKMDDYNVIILPTPWKRILFFIKEGKAFAFYPPYKRLKERPFVWPYSDPILKEIYSIFCAKGSVNSNPKWPDDFLNLKIAKNSGFAIPDLNYQNLKEYPSNEAAILSVAEQRNDCYINDQLSIYLTIQKLKENPIKRTLIEDAKIYNAAVLSEEDGFLGFSKKNNPIYKQDFIEKFNILLNEMKSSGEIEKIYSEFISNFSKNH